MATSFPVVVTIPVAWGDMDALGHVNNVMYLRYFESARVKYLDNLLTGEGKKSPIQPVLANMNCSYKKPVVYPDTLEVKVGVSQMGNSSLQMQCEMWSPSKGLVFEASCTIVMFDFVNHCPTRIPAPIRAYIEQLEESQ